MIEKLALNIVSQMEKQRIIDESNSEYYGYALITMIENTLTVGSVLFCYRYNLLSGYNGSTGVLQKSDGHVWNAVCRSNYNLGYWDSKPS